MSALGTPVVVDFFSRYFAGFYDEKNFITTPTAGQAFFGRPENGAYTIFSPNSTDVDLDIVRGNLKTAKMIFRGMAGRVTGTTHADLQVGAGTTFSRKFPLIEEQTNIGAAQLNSRLPGEGPYEGIDKATRLRELARRGYLENVRRVIRTNEVLTWQSLLLGVQSAGSLTDTSVNIYDFRRNSANTPSLTHGWGNAAGVPMTDIDSLCDTILFNGKLMPDFAIFGGTAMRYFMANQQVSTNFGNKLYFDLMQFGMDFVAEPKFARLVAAGLIPYGRLRTPKGFSLTIFTYPHFYALDAGTATKFFDDTKVLIGASNARADRYFGPGERIDPTSQDMQRMMERFGFNPIMPPMPQNIMGADQTVLPQSFYVDSYEGDQGKSITIRTQSAPIFVTTQTDCFGAMAAGVTS